MHRPNAGEDTSTLRRSARTLLELHGAARRSLLVLVPVSVLAGLVEAAALILFIRAALSITTDDLADFDVAGVSVDHSAGVLLAVAACLTLVAAGAHLLVARGSAAFALQILTNARTRLIDGFMSAPWRYQSSLREGSLQESITSIAHRASTSASFMAVGLSTSVILISVVVASLIVAPVVSVVMFGAVVPIALLLAPVARKARRRSQSSVRGVSVLAEEVAATATLAREYRTFGVDDVRAQHLRDITRRTAVDHLAGRRSTMIASFLFKDLALFAIIAIFGVLHLVIDLRETGAAASILLVVRVLGYAQATYNVMQSANEESSVVGELAARIGEVERLTEPEGAIRADTFQRLQFDDVSFSYVPDRRALETVSLELVAGTAVGLIGPSGSGKSTIAELILGLRHPDRGAVRLDGHDLRDIRRADYRRLAAFVPQDPRLSIGSVADNIAFHRTISLDAVVDAARSAHIHDTIMALPDGYDTIIGPRSQGLSGGQRQRLAIARALAGAPQLLVLDEPTSALDGESESLLTDTLFELKSRTTLVVIAHRPATLDVCDVVIEVGHGRIVRNRPGVSPRQVTEELSR